MLSPDKNCSFDEYHHHARRCRLLTLIFAVAAVLFAIASTSVGKYHIGMIESYEIIFDHLRGIIPIDYVGELKEYIVWDRNLPRAIAGLTVGVILAIGGAVMQSILRNPLADSYTTGISSGALFGVTVWLVLGVSLVPGADTIAQIINAFAFAMIPSLVIISITTFKKVTSTAMILIGIAVMYVFSASSSLLKYVADPDDLSEIYEWSIGTVGKAGWESVPFLIISALLMLVVMMLVSKKLNVLSGGDDNAKSLGVDPVKLRLFCLIIVSVSTAAAVCFTGTIGFVGLVAPHLGRIFVGSNNRYLIPCSASIGALMTISADCVARVIGNTGLPAGVVTALIGSPLFLYFLLKQRKSSW